MGRANLALTVREQPGLSQQSMATLIDVPVATLRNWEQGRVSPKGAGATLLKLLGKRPSLVHDLNGQSA